MLGIERCTALGNGGQQGGLHHLIQRGLIGRELTIDRKSTGNVGIVVGVFGPSIYQEQVAIM